MTRYYALTTMNETGYLQTGKRMIASFVERWPAEALPLTVYAEGFEIEPDPRVAVRSLPPWMAQFKHRHRLNRRAHGLGFGRLYDYRFDAVKFAHKVAAVTDLGASLTAGVMIWLDADTFTHSDVDVEWLESLFPGESYLAWLDRSNTHPECGFVMYRASHPAHQTMMQRYADAYRTDAVFRMPESNDCTVLKCIVDQAIVKGLIERPVSLSGDDLGWHHTFVAGPLGARLDHLKGARKKEGRSRQRDLKRPRTEDYWRRV